VTPALRATFAWLLAFLLVAAGVGWLYLVRHLGALDLGPRIPGALPLEQLAGEAPQPLGRMVVAWVPTGAAAGVMLVLLTRLRAGARLLGLAVLSFATLLVSTAASDAVAQNERFVNHLTVPLERAGVWTAVLLFVIGSLLAELAAPAERRASEAPAAS
jgi:hypothetical protein